VAVVEVVVVVVSVLMAIFPDGPGLASTRMFMFWILLALRMTEMEVVVTTGVVRRTNF